MADKKQQDAPAGAEVTQSADDAPGGVDTNPVDPITDVSKEEQAARLTNPSDVKLGVLNEPEHDADKSPYPVQQQPPLERPPFATGRPDVPIVQSAVTGAGAHTPPDPDQFWPDGRPKLDEG